MTRDTKNVIAKGTKVKWGSQAGGMWKEKVGEVVAVVPAGGDPNAALEQSNLPRRLKNPGMRRDHESYVVRANGKLYWPVVSKLKPVRSR